MTNLSLDHTAAAEIRQQLMQLTELRRSELDEACQRYFEMESRAGVSPDEAATRYAEAQVARAGADAARLALLDLDAALERLDLGRYGVCETCQRTIPAERLEVLPAARHCVPCHRRPR